MIERLILRARRFLPPVRVPQTDLGPMTYAEASARALADHDAACGRRIDPYFVAHPDWPSDVRDDHDVVYVVAPTHADDLTRHMDSHVDPIWNLTVIRDPRGVLKGEQGFWTHGQSIALVKEDAA